ncbi:MAG TPA: hypothetical protein DDW52_01200 [Planctomycetaceae bacterium]|nr:hypothetical protein [Planctomycetaceae bacterium]
MQKDSLSEDAQDCLDEIKGAVDRANRIVSELLDFTRETASNTQICSVKSIVEGALRLADIPATVTLEIEEAPELDVDVDADQIERILVNLLNNACQAMDQQGTIVLSTSIEDDMIILSVSDTGPGIAGELRERIFEPLFTTKITGIGLGLAVSSRYAQQNGGRIELASSDASGSTFQLKLPAITTGGSDAQQTASPDNK